MAILKKYARALLYHDMGHWYHLVFVLYPYKNPLLGQYQHSPDRALDSGLW